MICTKHMNAKVICSFQYRGAHKRIIVKQELTSLTPPPFKPFVEREKKNDPTLT